jgi:hypothetical protein
MNDPLPTFMKCPACGAVNRVGIDRTCWVCEQDLESPQPIRMTLSDDRDPPTSSLSPDRYVVLGIVSLAILGLLLVSPGLGILVLILSVIPLGRMMVLMRSGDTAAQGFGLYAGSLAVSIVICTVVGVTAFGAFCLSLCGVYLLDSRMMTGIMGALLVYGITGWSVILVCIPLGRWVIRRWKRDSQSSAHEIGPRVRSRTDPENSRHEQ